MRDGRRAKNTCIIRRGRELRNDMETERLQTMKTGEEEQQSEQRDREAQEGMTERSHVHLCSSRPVASALVRLRAGSILCAPSLFPSAGCWMTTR